MSLLLFFMWVFPFRELGHPISSLVTLKFLSQRIHWSEPLSCPIRSPSYSSWGSGSLALKTGFPSCQAVPAVSGLFECQLSLPLRLFSLTFMTSPFSWPFRLLRNSRIRFCYIQRNWRYELEVHWMYTLKRINIFWEDWIFLNTSHTFFLEGLLSPPPPPLSVSLRQGLIMGFWLALNSLCITGWTRVCSGPWPQPPEGWHNRECTSHQF